MKQKNKLKRFASIFLATSLVVGALAGCGATTSSNNGTGTSTNTNEGGGSSPETSSETIKIGANLELTGDVASYGSSILAGAELAIEEINAAGGIDGKQIELVKADNKSDNAEAAASALKLITQDKVHALIGPATSGNMLATVQIANQNKIPVVTGSGTAQNLTVNEDGSINEFIFRTCFIDPFQGVVAANFATGLGAKNVAIYADNSSDYAKGLAASFKQQIEANGGTVVAEEAYVANDVDFKSTLTNLKSANPDFVFIPGYYEEVGLIVKQARDIGIDVPLMGGDGWDSPTLVDLAGSDALNNTYMSNAFSSEDPEELIQGFVKAFEEKNGEKPNGFHALGYDTAYFIADAIDRADSTDGEAIKNALAETKDFAGVTGTFSVDENHNPIKSATILEFVDGGQVFNSKVNP